MKMATQDIENFLFYSYFILQMKLLYRYSFQAKMIVCWSADVSLLRSTQNLVNDLIQINIQVAINN